MGQYPNQLTIVSSHGKYTKGRRSDIGLYLANVLTLSSSIAIKPFGNVMAIGVIAWSFQPAVGDWLHVMTTAMYAEDGKYQWGS